MQVMLPNILTKLLQHTKMICRILQTAFWQSYTRGISVRNEIRFCNLPDSLDKAHIKASSNVYPNAHKIDANNLVHVERVPSRLRLL